MKTAPITKLTLNKTTLKKLGVRTGVKTGTGTLSHGITDQCSVVISADCKESKPG
jgi:hypothetical protein